MRRVLALSDAVGILLAFGLLSLLEAPLGQEGLLDVPLVDGNPVTFMGGAILLWGILATTAGSYHLDERRIEHSVANQIGQLIEVSAGWAWILVLADALLTLGTISIAPIAALWITMIPLILASRTVARHLASSRGWYRQPVFLIGSGTDTDRVGAIIHRHPEYGLEVARTIQLSEASGPTRARQLIETARDADVARVIFASSYEGLDERTGALRFLAEEGIKVDLVPGDSDVFRSDAELHFIEGLPILTLPTTGRPRSAQAVKRAMDVTLAGAGLVVLAPVFGYYALRIKLDSRGPVFFRQARAGRKGKTFQLFKFRTMVYDADTIKDTVAGLNVRTDGMFKVTDDPRITRFGAKLRRTSLDELPQLINVLRGEMSLVGPRPLIAEEAILVDERYVARFDVKPGMTGPWQVLGRSDIPFQKMVKLDYAYVVNWSIGEDLKFLVRTLSAMTQRRGAY